MTPVFIEAYKLGSVLESALRTALNEVGKRKRATAHKRIVRVLRDLHLLPFPTQQLDEHGNLDTSSPTGIALCVRSDGEIGLLVVYEPTMKVQGDLPK